MINGILGVNKNVVTLVSQFFFINHRCYVHGLTPVKNAGASKYVTCRLQTENQMIKAVRFSQEKKAH